MDLQAEKLQDAIAVKKSGSLRINVESPNPRDSKTFLTGDSQGVVYVDGDRRVTTDIRA